MSARGPPPTTAAAADLPPMTHGGAGRLPRTCAAAALPGSKCPPPRVVLIAIGAPSSDHAPLMPVPVASVLCAPQRDASAAWTGGCHGHFDTLVSLPAAAAADDGAETVN